MNVLLSLHWHKDDADDDDDNAYIWDEDVSAGVDEDNDISKADVDEDNETWVSVHFQHLVGGCYVPFKKQVIDINVIVRYFDQVLNFSWGKIYRALTTLKLPDITSFI